MTIQNLTRVISILIHTNNNINISTKMELYLAINNYASNMIEEQNKTNKKIQQLENEVETLKYNNNINKINKINNTNHTSNIPPSVGC